MIQIINTYHDKVGKVFPVHDDHLLRSKGNAREKFAALTPRVLAGCSRGTPACRQRPMYFEKAGHRYDRAGSQVGSTIMIICLEMCLREIKDIPQVILELPDKILRKFDHVTIASRFAGDETVNMWSACNTHNPQGVVSMSVHLYRAKTSWFST